MDIDDLLLLTLLGAGFGVTKTAKKLGVAQPAISQRLRKLEAIFNGKIIIKKRREIELTALGVELSDGARNSLLVLMRSIPYSGGDWGRYALVHDVFSESSDRAASKCSKSDS